MHGLYSDGWLHGKTEHCSSPNFTISDVNNVIDEEINKQNYMHANEYVICSFETRVSITAVNRAWTIPFLYPYKVCLYSIGYSNFIKFKHYKLHQFQLATGILHVVAKLQWFSCIFDHLKAVCLNAASASHNTLSQAEPSFLRKCECQRLTLLVSSRPAKKTIKNSAHAHIFHLLAWHSNQTKSEPCISVHLMISPTWSIIQNLILI